MRGFAFLLLALMASSAQAESLIAVRTLRAGSVIAARDVVTSAAVVPGAATDLSSILGQEARVAIYQGRPIRIADLGPPAIVDRNQDVTLVYAAGALTIVAEGRALGRGGVGDLIKVQNIGSRATVSGVIAADGTVRVATGN